MSFAAAFSPDAPPSCDPACRAIGQTASLQNEDGRQSAGRAHEVEHLAARRDRTIPRPRPRQADRPREKHERTAPACLAPCTTPVAGESGLQIPPPQRADDWLHRSGVVRESPPPRPAPESRQSACPKKLDPMSFAPGKACEGFAAPQRHGLLLWNDPRLGRLCGTRDVPGTLPKCRQFSGRAVQLPTGNGVAEELPAYRKWKAGFGIRAGRTALHGRRGDGPPPRRAFSG